MHLKNEQFPFIPGGNMQSHRTMGNTGSAQVFQREDAPVCTTSEELCPLQGALENILREKGMSRELGTPEV